MSYNLTSDVQTNIQSKEDLEKFVKAQPTMHLESMGDRLHCLICCENRADVASIERGCMCYDRPCEGHHCKCSKPYQVCSKCIVTQLWENTNSIMKQRQKFRSHCALCKAEFCSLDIVLLPTL